MIKFIHKVFKDVVNKPNNVLRTLVESGSEVSHFIPESSNFSEVTKLPADVKKVWLKATLKDIKNLIDNQNFLMDDPEKRDHVKTCMDVYKANIQSGGSLDKLKLRILVIGYLQNKEVIGDTWDKTESMRNLKYFLEDAAKHNERVNQLDFTEAFIQSNVKHSFFMKLDSRYGEHFPEYTNYYGRP